MSSEEAAVVEIHRVCERFHAAIELIGGRWTGAILRAVFTGQHRFAHIRAAVPGLSDTMLAQRLRTLEQHDVLERRVGAAAATTGPNGTAATTGPTQVEYHLTAKGRELAPVLDAVIAWSHRWIPLADADPADGAAAAAPGTSAVSATPVPSTPAPMAPASTAPAL